MDFARQGEGRYLWFTLDHCGSGTLYLSAHSVFLEGTLSSVRLEDDVCDRIWDKGKAFTP